EDKTKKPPFLKTDRGGKTTFHGPGQLVIYFILNMKKLPFSPTKLTSVILKNTLEVLEGFGLKSNIQENDPGIFIEGKKVASIGMRIKKNYSYHGLSVNINTDLRTFNTIKPCGLEVEACNLKDYINIKDLELKDKLLAKFKTTLIK
ncbi:MAG: lipoyl(octanoyl) transferase LipB, partial [Gammaproteobacteria bacterium]